MSLVHIAYIPFFERMDVALSAFKDFEIRSLALPHLNAWLKAMLNRESYQKTRLELERIKELHTRFLNLNYFKRVGVACGSDRSKD